MICGSSIFKNSLVIVYFIYTPTGIFKREQGNLFANYLWRATFPEEEEILKTRLARLHKQVTVYILHRGNKERSRAASKDIMIFYLVCSRNRGKRESGVLVDRRICCRKTTFLSMFHIWWDILCLSVMIYTNVPQWDGASLETSPSSFSPPFLF